MSDYNPFSLNGKTILVTGASSGIGRSIAIECSRMGAKLCITARNEDKLKETLSKMSGSGHILICTDISDEESISALVESLPQLDGVVHCAGIADRIICKMVKKENVDKLMATNYTGPVMLQKYLLKKKKLEPGSSVAFIASRAPFSPSVGNAFYAATKGALIAYSKCLALEVAAQQIRVNCVCPAMVWTDLIAKDAEINGVDYKETQMSYPLKRFGKPEDIAYLCVYLMSDASSWMTGSQIDITGGGEGLLK